MPTRKTLPSAPSKQSFTGGFFCVDNRTATVYTNTMKTFKEGDRVKHTTLGEGTIVNPYEGTGWPTVLFNNGSTVTTSDFLLTPVPKTVPEPAPAPLKVGDRVHHALHGSATVVGIEEDFNLVTIRPEFYRDGSTKAVHPVSLTLAEQPKENPMNAPIEVTFRSGVTVRTMVDNLPSYLATLPMAEVTGIRYGAPAAKEVRLGDVDIHQSSTRSTMDLTLFDRDDKQVAYIKSTPAQVQLFATRLLQQTTYAFTDIVTKNA